ncbi:MAG: hypothetical protein HY332_07075 [Chloroflexi bacterium]|nr:hypothetical protein [Chloroflexota bacterium]
MANWKQQTLKLKKNHGWKAKPGYKIFVAERGAVRFDVPRDWIMIPDSVSVKFHDLPPPDDNCRLEVSYLHLPPAVDWRGLPLTELLEHVIKDDHRDIIARGTITHVERPDLEYAWTEIWFTDPATRRMACTRACLARGSNVQPFITLDFWPEDADRFISVWDEVLRSLQLGQYVKDPTRRRLD